MSVLKQQLLDKINNKTAKVGVVGLGYVGLPLAVEKANAGYQTIGFDVQEETKTCTMRVFAKLYKQTITKNPLSLW